ncbi:MAG: hypothetical protein SGBAC_008590 [Bacillariaceae sp.]
MKISVQCLLWVLAFSAANAQTITTTTIGQQNEASKQQVITGAPISVPTNAPVLVQTTVITGAPISVPTNAPVTPINTVITGAPVSRPTRAPAQNTVNTGAPVPVITAAPVPQATPAPVSPPVTAPVPQATTAPVNPPTAAPVNPPTAAPFPVVTTAPVNPPTAAPVNLPTAAPVLITTAPVIPPAAAPVNPPTASPVRITTAPVNPPTAAPVNPQTTAPVNPPTVAPVLQPTTAPVPTNPSTESPTESPAPSPSPSAVPTIPPTLSVGPTIRPTGEPTESPAPSPSPSAVPTNLPTTLPSIAPSGNPTLTFKPSISPTQTFKPSSRPTGTPSKLPTGAPSVEPTKNPTTTPSVIPTSEPTEEAFKTKFSNVKLILMDIEHEMLDDQIEQFEITTLEFVNDTAPRSDEYEIDILAVTLLSQTVIYPDAVNETDQGERRMQTAAALEVTFKTVGLVTEGRTPYDFDFKRDIASVGFENHMDQYYYILGSSDIFFEPLKAHTDFQDPMVEDDKGKFVAAVVFSMIAFLIAIFASIYAIRRHLRVKKRRSRQRRVSEAQKSNTYSDHSTDDSDEENPFQPPLQLNISPGKMELENVPITPRSLASPFKQDYRDGGAPPMSPDTPSDAEPTVLEGTGAAIRKWLTPRVASPKENEFKENGKPPKPTSSPDPMALKARTTDATGTFTKGGNSTKNANSKFGQSPLTIPMSFFGGQNSDGESENETPMGSLAESAASSFFNRFGKSVFTGKPSDAPRPSTESFLRARDRFSPRESFDEDEQKRNDAIFTGRSRSTSAVPPKVEKKSLLNDEVMKRHRTSYQPSEVSDVSLNEFKGGEDKYKMLKAPSSVASSRASHLSSNTLGARARESTSSDNSLNALRSKPESYDVFAPSGPIGIVVDTSKNGPAVHSLKTTSPMLGLINPGDLIIALDDEDTRKMTAASLTRLMAKKSRQKERKITLLSLD